MKAQKEKTNMCMRVKVIETFTNPLTGRMLKKGQELNVPKHRFWFKRIQAKEVELVEKKKAKAAPKVEPKSDKKETKQGSK